MAFNTYYYKTDADEGLMIALSPSMLRIELARRLGTQTSILEIRLATKQDRDRLELTLGKGELT